MEALTWGGFMWTFSFPPTSSRTVAVKRESFFNTWGGCFSMINVLETTNKNLAWTKSNNYQKIICHIIKRSSLKRGPYNIYGDLNFQYKFGNQTKCQYMNFIKTFSAKHKYLWLKWPVKYKHTEVIDKPCNKRRQKWRYSSVQHGQ